MWESRRDFHTLSFPWPAFCSCEARCPARSTSVMGRTRAELFVVIVVDDCFGEHASVETICTPPLNVRGGYKRSFWKQPKAYFREGHNELILRWSNLQLYSL
jgi:hypothetical protein